MLYGNQSGTSFLGGGGGGEVGPTPTSELLIEAGETHFIQSGESQTHLAVRNGVDSETVVGTDGELTLETI